MILQIYRAKTKGKYKGPRVRHASSFSTGIPDAME